MFNLIRKLLMRNAPKEPDVWETRFTEEMTVKELKEMLAGEKDFQVRATPEGKYTGTCKSCREPLWLAPQDGVFWFRCPKCGRMTCYLEANVRRDILIAKKEGRPFEYELYFRQDWPPNLIPPFRDSKAVSQGGLRCPQCSASYSLADYRVDAEAIRCSACGAPLPR